jgi:aspartyl-tRNA(Asn)/glutamyl-tRNA(Gln) amidotransferase subunit A
MMRGRDMSAADYIELLKARADWIRAVETRFAPFDAVLMPTVPTIAPRIEALADEAEYGRINLLMLRNPAIINFLDGCAISIPCHTAGEAPVGLMVAAQGGRDRAVLAIGQAISLLG